MSDKLTLEEQEKILMVAEALIAEPANWVRGNWKCAATKYDKEQGKRVPSVDPNGARLYNYCIEGAVNEAARRVLGDERLIELDWAHKNRNGSLGSDYKSSRTPTQAMGLNAIAAMLYNSSTALSVNDSRSFSRKKGHERVMNILRTGLASVRANLERRKK